MKRVNFRFLAIILVALALLGVAIGVVHRIQSRRHAHVYLEKARAAVEAGQLPEAIELFGRYLTLAPNDVEARAEVGLVQADMGRYAQAYGTLQTVLRSLPERNDLRRRLVEVAIRIGRYNDAVEQIEKHLLPGAPKDAKLWAMLAACQSRLALEKQAAASLEKAIRHAPDQVENYMALAELLRRRDSGAQGPAKDSDKRLDPNVKLLDPDFWIDDMISKNLQSARAYVLAGHYVQKWPSAQVGKYSIKAPEQYAAEALRLAPDDPDARLLAAQLALRKTGLSSQGPAQRKLAFDQARQHAQHGVKVAPTKSAFYVVLAQIELGSNDAEKAIEWLDAGLKKIPEDTDLLWYKALVLLDRDKSEAAKETKETVERLEAAVTSQVSLAQARGRSDAFQAQLVLLRARNNYLQGRLYFLRPDYAAAKEEFLKAHASLTDKPDLLADVNRWLARCYERLRDREKQIAACRSAVRAGPTSPRLRIELAAALDADGQLDEAIEEQRTAVGQPGAPADGLIQLARWLIQRNARLEPAQRAWEEALGTLDRAEPIIPDAVEIPLFRAEIYAMKGQLPEARKLLEEKRTKRPDQFAFWAAEARIAQWQRDWVGTDRILNEAEQKLGDTVGLRLVRARYLVDRYGKEAVKQLRQLAEKTDRFTDPQRVVLWRELAAALLQLGDTEQAKDLALRAAKMDLKNIPVRLVAFDAAIRTKDDALMKQILDEVKAIEGEGATWLVARAVQLKTAARPQDTAVLEEALQHLDKARKLPPNWPRVPLLIGEIQDLLGRGEQALAAYLEAIDRGERDPAVVRRVIELLYTMQNYEGFTTLIRQLAAQPSALDSPEARGMAAEMSLRGEDFEYALTIARQGAAGSKDYRDYLLLGQVLFENAKRAPVDPRLDKAKAAKAMLQEAEKSLRQANQIAPDSWITWPALIRLLAETGQTQEAEKALTQAKQKIPAAESHRALAPCYEAVGKLAEAAAEYEAALAASPDLALARQVVRFYLVHAARREAQTLLEKVIDGRIKVDPKDGLPWARRTLASLLADSRMDADHQRAFDLIEQNLESNPTSAEDLRVKAVLLAHDFKTQPRTEPREKAVAILENLLKSPRTAIPADRVLLAQMHLEAGNWRQFTTTMRPLLAFPKPDPQILGSYVEALLQREPKELKEAENWLGRLEQLAPNDLATVRLRARLLFYQGSHDEAIKRLDDFLTKARASPNHPVLLLTTVTILEDFAKEPTLAGKPDAAKYAGKAEALTRQYVGQQPEQGLLLAGLLARWGRTEEALQAAEPLCAKAAPVAIAEFTAQLAGSGSATPQQLTRLEALLTAAMAKHGRPVPLLLAMADLRTVQQRFDDVESLYAELLRGNENDIVVLNNWAVLLALRGKDLDRAAQMIDKAIQLADRRDPTLLDSRASVAAARNRTREALDDLKEAIARAPRPTRYFHLAQVQLQMQNKKDAAAAWSSAKKAGLKPETLHPLERPAYDKLKQTLQ